MTEQQGGEPPVSNVYDLYLWYESVAKRMEKKLIERNKLWVEQHTIFVISIASGGMEKSDD